MNNLFVTSPFLDKDRSYSLKGFVMILIICHHIYQRVDFTQWPFGHFLSSFGYIGTGIFFFLSGFGLFMSLKNKKSLTIDWIVKKMKKLLLPFVYIMTIVGTFCLLTKDDYTIDVFIKEFFTLTTPYTFAWFYKVIVGIYVIIFLVFRLNIDNYKKVLIVNVLTFIYYIIAKTTLPGCWSSSVLNFPLGMAIGLFWDKINVGDIFRSGRMLPVIIVMYLGCFFKLGFVPELLSVISTFFYCYIVRYVNINYRLLDYIGKESLNFYIFQLALLKILLDYFNGWIGYGVALFVMTSILSIIYTEFICPIIYNLHDNDN